MAGKSVELDRAEEAIIQTNCAKVENRNDFISTEPVKTLDYHSKAPPLNLMHQKIVLFMIQLCFFRNAKEKETELKMTCFRSGLANNFKLFCNFHPF